MTRLLMLAAAVLAVASAPAFAASDAGGRKLQPAHGYMQTPAAVQRFKNVREVAYEENTQSYSERAQDVEGSAYGDQPNVIPAKERVYHYDRADMSDTPSVTYKKR